MNVKQLLLQQLAAIYDQDRLFVCFTTAINGLDDYEAHYRVDVGQANTIAEIIHHLNFYNARFLSRFCGEEVEELPSYYNTFTFDRKVDWRKIEEQSHNTFRQFRKVILISSDEKLEKWSDTLGLLWLHNGYHIGQIVQIRKEFGSWSKSPIVKG
ncbi:hypothetical protein H0266_15980 [Halobacillus locisalis]|uniref:DinB superfamily protein n=1 Tax=Halobacillus locisalis TaxID=220753 RepID=A0A838CWI3_9BACI|nr:hypothetical protein [Halobacillus locisalis]